MGTQQNPTPRFLSARQAREYNDPRLSPFLRVVLGSALRAASAWSWTPLVISIYRTEAEEQEIERQTGKPTSRIHSAWRACDLRTIDASDEAIEAVTRGINGLYEYDSARPGKLVAFGEPHGTGPHLHLQVHPDSRVRLSATRGMG